MINPSREQVSVALFTLLSSVSGISIASRRPVLWDNATKYPSLYMGNPSENYIYRNGTASPPEVTLDFDVFVYTKSPTNPDVAPDTQMNNLLDSIDAALQPALGPSPGAVQTLGGIVNHAWIEGPVHRAPGYLDGKGMALFTIRVLVP